MAVKKKLGMKQNWIHERNLNAERENGGTGCPPAPPYVFVTSEISLPVR